MKSRIVKNKVKRIRVSLIKKSLENINYGSYYQNTYFDDLPIKYEQRLFTKQLIDFSIGNMREG